MNRTERERLEAEADAVVDAVWADEQRVLEDGEAQYYQINFAMERERRAQENYTRLAAAAGTHLIGEVLNYTPFSQMTSTPLDPAITSAARFWWRGWW